MNGIHTTQVVVTSLYPQQQKNSKQNATANTAKEKATENKQNKCLF